MADSFLENAGGFTPVPDHLVRRYDFTTAYVWGKIWRYCQMANGVCTASHGTIANRAGMSRRTLIDKLNILIKDGYIEDTTPNLKNKPHTYCTKIGEVKIEYTMQISHTENTIPEETVVDPVQNNDIGMRNLHSDNAEDAQSDNPTMQELPSHYAEFAQPTMQNLHLKKDSLETPLRDNKERSASKPTRPPTSPTAKILVEETGKCYLNAAQLKVTDREVGNTPEALEKWRESTAAWNLNGCNPKDAQGMLDWFRTGKRSKYNGKDSTNGQHKPKRQQQSSPLIPLTPAEQEQFARMAALANDTG